MSTLVMLFLEFFKTGLFAVGGGLATIPFLREMESVHPEWFLNVNLVDIIAVAESTPGPIGINAATYCGYSAAGILGAVVATLSLVLPSLIIVTIIAKGYSRYHDSPLVSSVFSVLRPAVAGLIAAAGYSVLLLATMTGSGSGLRSFDWRCLVLFAVLFGLLQIKPTKKVHPVFYILFGAAVGLVLGL